MLSGSTNNNKLVELGANFWTPWADPKHPDNQAFYERTGFPEGFLGPIYGWQMRHFGGDYKRSLYWSDWYKEWGGFDQISWLVNEIKSNPDSRRLIVSLWNPVDMHMMRLPPCHYCFHVFVDTQGRISLLLNQRSVDTFIGAPANIQFYSALCHMLAQQTGYKPHQFIHHMEDAHIYLNQIEHVKEYLSREPKPSPRLTLNKADDIFSYKVSDFTIEDYDPHPPIKAPVTI